MARRKATDLENQMSLMDMMASESPEYTEEGPEELLGANRQRAAARKV